MQNYRKNLGNWGEKMAEEYLLQHGYSILDRNVRTSHGEIDLVVRKANGISNLEASHSAENMPVIIFVEVKTRASARFGFPELSITPQKQAHMLQSAQAYLQAHPELDGDWRLDVISVIRSANDPSPQITHFENAVI